MGCVGMEKPFDRQHQGAQKQPDVKKGLQVATSVASFGVKLNNFIAPSGALDKANKALQAVKTIQKVAQVTDKVVNNQSRENDRMNQQARKISQRPNLQMPVQRNDTASAINKNDNLKKQEPIIQNKKDGQGENQNQAKGHQSAVDPKLDEKAPSEIIKKHQIKPEKQQIHQKKPSWIGEPSITPLIKPEVEERPNENNLGNLESMIRKVEPYQALKNSQIHQINYQNPEKERPNSKVNGSKFHSQFQKKPSPTSKSLISKQPTFVRSEVYNNSKISADHKGSSIVESQIIPEQTQYPPHNQIAWPSKLFQ